MVSLPGGGVTTPRTGEVRPDGMVMFADPRFCWLDVPLVMVRVNATVVFPAAVVGVTEAE